MKKKMMRIISILMTCSIVFGSVTRVPAASADAPSDTAAGTGVEKNSDSVPAAADAQAPAEGTSGNLEQPGDHASGSDGTSGSQGAAGDQNTSGSQDTAGDQNASGNQDAAGDQNAAGGDNASGSGDAEGNPGAADGQGSGDGQNETGGQDTPAPDNTDISGSVTTDNNQDISGVVTVEQDKNDDNVEIKKNDKPYLALGTDLTDEQRATVLALMGIDASSLGNYDVVTVNNAEEHQYLDSYIDKSKIGSKSLSSIVIVERGDGNGINISTQNITYCTVGMYKNALATAGIQNADIIVAAPFPISGTAALVGIFKAYKEMTGDEIDEENIDAALHELVVTGQLEAGGASSDDIEGMIAYVKQAVVEHDMSDESEIRKAIEEGCEKFGLTLTDEEKEEVVALMQKISELDLDLDGLLNAAQSIYDKIKNADGGFWAKVREIFITLWDKIKELF